MLLIRQYVAQQVNSADGPSVPPVGRQARPRVQARGIGLAVVGRPAAGGKAVGYSSLTMTRALASGLVLRIWCVRCPGNCT